MQISRITCTALCMAKEDCNVYKYESGLCILGFWNGFTSSIDIETVIMNGRDIEKTVPGN